LMLSQNCAGNRRLLFLKAASQSGTLVQSSENITRKRLSDFAISEAKGLRSKGLPVMAAGTARASAKSGAAWGAFAKEEGFRQRFPFLKESGQNPERVRRRRRMWSNQGAWPQASIHWLSS
jgi:hypothetical protein